MTTGPVMSHAPLFDANPKLAAAMEAIEADAQLHARTGRRMAESFALTGLGYSPSNCEVARAEFEEAVTELVDGRYRFDTSDELQSASRKILIRYFVLSSHLAFLERLHEVYSNLYPSGGRA